MALRKTVRKARRPRRYAKRYKRYGSYRKRSSKDMHRYTRMEAQDGGAFRTISCNFGASGWNATALTFDLGRVTDYSEFTNLYDNYKITGVQVNFDYTPDVVSSAPVPDTFVPKIWIVRDYNDATTPNIDDMTQSTRVKVIRPFPGKSYSVFLRPAILQQVYKSVVTNGNVPKWNQWIDCNDYAVPHYGLKLVTQGLPSTNMGSVSLRIKYYLKFRNVR